MSRRPASAPRAVGGGVGARAPITLSLDHLPDSSRGSSLMGRNNDGTIVWLSDERWTQSTTAAWEESSPSGGRIQRPQAMMQASKPSSRPGSGSGSTPQPHFLCPLDAAVAAAAEASRGAALILAEGAAQSSGSHQQHNMIRQPLTRNKRNSSPGQLLPSDAGYFSNAAGAYNTGPISAICAASLSTVSGAADQTDMSLLTVEALRAELEAVRAATTADELVEARWRSVCSSLQAEIDEVCVFVKLPL